MLYQGKYYITIPAIRNILDMEDEANLHAKDFSSIAQVKLNKVVYYSQADVYAYKEDIETKDIFLKEVQACVMLAMDLTSDNKTTFANKLGFEKLGSLDSFLCNKTYTPKCAAVFVKLWRNYKNLVKRYDNEEF